MLRVLQDSLRAAYVHGGDAARPDSLTSPLPGGVAALVRFIFGVPQWIQIGGLVVGLVVAVVVLRYLWRRRQAIVTWIKTRERGVKIGMAAGVVALVVFASGAGAVSWNYMQHDNGFCTGCHVMSKPFGIFQARAGKHDRLQCHDCHQQSIYASARQLVLWVAERPEKIGKHAKVPTAICSGCHVNGPEQKETWQRIAETAGHRVHLESDSSALKDVECVTCHGQEVHKFVPVSETCQQSGCHENLEIKLGGMAQQTSLHCVTCHQFTVEVPKLATRDSAAGTLVPTNKQCLSCHEMRQVLQTFDPDRDPHNGTCGTCHNPHTQTKSTEAAKSCTTAGCHDNWRNEPFHVGVAHRKVGQECTTCHNPHAAKVDPSDCQACHDRVRSVTSGGRRLNPPSPFDTTRALRRESEASRDAGGGPVTGFLGWGWPTPPPRGTPTPVAAGSPAAPADSFPHPRHRRLTCLTCHTSNIRHGRLTFEQPRGCQICHHQAPKTSDCATCHQPEELGAAVLQARVTVKVPDQPARERPVAFRHEKHSGTTCVTCHTTPVTLTPDTATATCQNCHEDHHRSKADCSGCHTGVDLKPAHSRPKMIHRACDECHTGRIIGELTPTRPLCVTCHQPQRDHYPARECTACHFLATPEAYRSHLLKAGNPGGGR
ncbi:MAG: hypothetical protein AB7S39_14635 [Gemmatimonadales bacterium]